MRDTQQYQQVLGLTEPWSVDRVELKIDEGRVDIWVEHRPGHVWACPECGRSLSCRDHAEERAWRHLDTCQLKTYLHARIPRVECPEHGVRQMAVPWAEPHSRFTMLMERLIIDVATQCATVTGVCALTDTSWDEAWGVMRRAVARGQARKAAEPVAHLGVDEKAFRKGHSYMTVVCDLDRATVEYVAEDRKSTSLAAYFRSLSPRQLEGIQAVAMDMWEPYVKATLECVPLAADTVRRIRVKDSVEYVWWLAKTPWPKACNSKVLRPYSKDMLRLNARKVRATIRPSGHVITSGFDKIEAGGSIPPNVIDEDAATDMLRFGNNAANDQYTMRCKEAGIKIHPARFPAALPEFFIRMLTDHADLVVDPFAGSNTTGMVAEQLGRRWIAIETSADYLESSKFRFDF